MRSIVDNLYLSPLRGLPGALIEKLSQTWLLLSVAAGHCANYFLALHRRYGPVIRIAPYELLLASAAAAPGTYVGVSVTVEAAAASHESSRTKSRTAQPTAAAPSKIEMATRMASAASAAATTAMLPRTTVAKTFLKP